MKTDEEAQRLWEENVYDRAEEVDPDGEYDWWDMAFGFFMGLGFEPDDAADLANNAKL